MGINHVRDLLDSSVEWSSSTQKLLAIIMSYGADRRGIVRLTQQEIGDQARISRRRVATLVDELGDLEVIVRLGHGRYGIRYGLPRENDEAMVPAKKGARKELERLMALRQPDQFVAYRHDGWPVLQDRASREN